MQYEVEQKFPVEDLAAVVERLAAMGAKLTEPHEEVDRYFAHPARNFAETDEALRLRRKGEKFLITYKGPKIDTTTKTRQELELPLVADQQSLERWTELLERLGFRQVADVRKQRRKTAIAWQGASVEGSLDEVDRVGQFVELELVVDEHQLDTARATIASLAEKLPLGPTERRSYLELLLEAGGGRQ